MSEDLALAVQLVLSVLAIPVVTVALTGLGRLISPTRRMSTQIMSDLAIYKDLPEGEVKTILGEQVGTLTMQLVNYRSRRKAPIGKVIASALTLFTAAVVTAGIMFIVTGQGGRLGTLAIFAALGAGGIFTLAMSLNVGLRKEWRSMLAREVAKREKQVQEETQTPPSQ